MSEVITGGVVSWEDQNRVEGFPTQKARVELRFDVPEGADAEKALDRVDVLTRAKVAQMLGCKAPAAGRTDKDRLAEAAGVQMPTEEPKKKPAKAPKIDVEEKKPDPAAMDDFNVEVAEPAAKQVSDAELNETVKKKNDALKDPQAIRALIATHCTEAGKPKVLASIPQAGRAAFLEALAKLGS